MAVAGRTEKIGLSDAPGCGVPLGTTDDSDGPTVAVEPGAVAPTDDAVGFVVAKPQAVTINSAAAPAAKVARQRLNLAGALRRSPIGPGTEPTLQLSSVTGLLWFSFATVHRPAPSSGTSTGAVP
jgi:hypothetical protein